MITAAVVMKSINALELLTVTEVSMSNELETNLLKQRDEAVQVLREVMENFKFNEKKGLGLGVMLKAHRLLERYPHVNSK